MVPIQCAIQFGGNAYLKFPTRHHVLSNTVLDSNTCANIEGTPAAASAEAAAAAAASRAALADAEPPAPLTEAATADFAAAAIADTLAPVHASHP